MYADRRAGGRRDRDANLRRIAAELAVGYVAVGAVRKRQRQIRLTVDLVDARALHSVWTETYDCSLDELFAVRETITRILAPILRSDSIFLAAWRPLLARQESS